MSSTLTSSEAVLYLYCFTLPGLPPPKCLGVDENHPVEVHDCGGLAAVVSKVSLQDFTGAAGERNLHDQAWIDRHAAVIEQTMNEGPVYPLAFGTLFPGLAALDQEIEHHYGDIAKRLRLVTDCQEWSVEATLDRACAIETLLHDRLRSGRYRLPVNLVRRRSEKQKLRVRLAAELDNWLEECNEAIQQTLARGSRDIRSQRLIDEQLLHWAYLIPVGLSREFKEVFKALARRYEAYGLQLRLTGPKPPYTFCQTCHSSPFQSRIGVHGNLACTEHCEQRPVAGSEGQNGLGERDGRQDRAVGEGLEHPSASGAFRGPAFLVCEGLRLSRQALPDAVFEGRVEH